MSYCNKSVTQTNERATKFIMKRAHKLLKFSTTEFKTKGRGFIQVKSVFSPLVRVRDNAFEYAYHNVEFAKKLIEIENIPIHTKLLESVETYKPETSFVILHTVMTDDNVMEAMSYVNVIIPEACVGKCVGCHGQVLYHTKDERRRLFCESCEDAASFITFDKGMMKNMETYVVRLFSERRDEIKKLYESKNIHGNSHCVYLPNPYDVVIDALKLKYEIISLEEAEKKKGYSPEVGELIKKHNSKDSFVVFFAMCSGIGSKKVVWSHYKINYRGEFKKCRECNGAFFIGKKKTRDCCDECK